MNTISNPNIRIKTFPNEQWKFVKNDAILDNSYLVSSMARVYSLISNRLLHPTKHSQGYLALTMLRKKAPDNPLSEYGTRYKKVLLHDLVGVAFVKNPCPGVYTVINHIDGDKRNNLPSNLEWVTQKMNVEHAYRTGLQHAASQPGLTNPNSRYDEIMIHWMCFLMENYGTTTAARLFVESFPQFKPKSVYKYMQTKLKAGYLYQDIASRYDIHAGSKIERTTGRLNKNDIRI